MAQSIKESREQLALVMEEWARAVSVERFFEGIQSRAENLPEEQREEVLKRVTLAREFVGTNDPLDFFRSWKTPLERYVPLPTQMSRSRREEHEG